MALKSVAEEYFSNLNPIAARICTDLKETKCAYEELWGSLSQEEKEQILTETIIKPEVMLKYSSIKRRNVDEYAVKIVMDDHCSYRDEHSGPFTFRTRSQRNLTVFQSEAPRNILSEISGKARKKPLPKPVKNVPLFVQDVELEDIAFNGNEDKSNLDGNSSLPKTGLDFLDNW